MHGSVLGRAWARLCAPSAFSFICRWPSPDHSTPNAQSHASIHTARFSEISSSCERAFSRAQAQELARSEREPERELHRARPALLILGGNCTEAGVQHLGSLTKGGV